MTFWKNQCKKIPDSGKVGQYLGENEMLIFDIDSIDVWLKVTICMKEAENLVEAQMDLKVDKAMKSKDFEALLQKLSLKMWNECCQVILDKKRRKSTFKH
jgi:hypothetical protein